MNICTDCGQPTSRGATARASSTALRCFVCEAARNPPPLPPRLEERRARRRIYDTMKRRARGARQISR